MLPVGEEWEGDEGVGLVLLQNCQYVVKFVNGELAKELTCMRVHAACLHAYLLAWVSVTIYKIFTVKTITDL